MCFVNWSSVINLDLFCKQIFSYIGTNLESILPTNLCNVQRYQHKVNCTKDALLFQEYLWWKFAAYFRLQLLHWALYFVTFLPDAGAFKSIRNYLRKSYSALVLKMLMKESPSLRPVACWPGSSIKYYETSD